MARVRRVTPVHRVGLLVPIVTSMLLVSIPTEVRASLHPPIHPVLKKQVHGRSRTPTHVRCAHRSVARGALTVSDPYYAAFGPNLNPTSAAAASFAPALAMFDDLFRYDNKAHLYPMMAAGVPSLRNGGVRAGGREIVIRLKQGLRWSNGSEITSADIKFGWRMSMDPASGPACGGSCDVIKSIDTPDRYTAVLHLKRVDPALLSPSVIQNGAMPIVWPAHWSGWSGDPHADALKLFHDPADTFIGPSYPTNGPYQDVSASRTQAVFRPMKYYDDMSCGAFVAKLVIRTYDAGASLSSAGQVLAASAGKIDVGVDYYPPDAPNLIRHRGRYHVHIEPTFAFEQLVLNLDSTYQSRPNPLSNAKVRLALALALDKRALVETALSLDSKHAKQIEAWTPWVVSRHLVQPYADRRITGQWDPLASHGKGAYLSSTGSSQALSDARKLLTATPWKNGFSLDFYTTPKPERLRNMATLAKQWAKLGVHVIPHTATPYPDFFGPWEQGGILHRGAYQVAELAEIGGSNPDDLATLLQSAYVDRDQTSHNSVQDTNYGGVRDSKIDKSFSQAIRTFNVAARRRDFKVVQERLNRRAYWIPLYYAPSISSSSSRISGYKPDPQAFNLWNIYDWKLRG